MAVHLCAQPPHQHIQQMLYVVVKALLRKVLHNLRDRHGDGELQQRVAGRLGALLLLQLLADRRDGVHVAEPLAGAPRAAALLTRRDEGVELRNDVLLQHLHDLGAAVGLDLRAHNALRLLLFLLPVLLVACFLFVLSWLVRLVAVSRGSRRSPLHDAIIVV
ncbi:hypothetical protein STCU_11196 [Strigomonas culicis]|uniref:Uncharacterized protein n=1 Tax=Strigomonas culicis TaxID=28005 RepID=S9V123_9TRYP|nr:hypothetical protein STCU_11196 [Strigomonas culicis]|eukprot:EPY16500.1 hypothetical protein STCU_11196 [Strigomonas culicis]